MKRLYWVLTLIPITFFKTTPKAVAQTTVNLSELKDIKNDFDKYETPEDLIQRLKQSKSKKIRDLRNSLLKDTNKLEKQNLVLWFVWCRVLLITSLGKFS